MSKINNQSELNQLDDRENMPLVSIIIPTYNRALYIMECINSVLQQTYKNIEVIVVDDGSNDNTHELIKTISDPRLHYIYQNHSGRSIARNLAILRSKGKFIAFLDSDDMYLPNKVELQVNYLQSHPGTGMVYTSAHCISATGELFDGEYIANTSGLLYEKVAFFLPVTITLPTVMTYRYILDHVGYFDEEMYRFEDTDLSRRISKSYRIDAMPNYTCKLRTHADNSILSQNPQAICTALKYYANKILNEDNEYSIALRKNGLSKLYSYYSAAILTIPKNIIFGKQLAIEAANLLSKSTNAQKQSFLKKTAIKALNCCPVWLQIISLRIYIKFLFYYSYIVKIINPVLNSTRFLLNKILSLPIHIWRKIKIKSIMLKNDFVRNFKRAIRLSKRVFKKTMNSNDFSLNLDPKEATKSAKTLEEKFTKVYKQNLFGGKLSRSGEGSNLEQTKIIREQLPVLLKKNNVKSLVDAPCGDWYWMRNIKIDIKEYIGIDIVEDLINKNNLNYANESIKFIKSNIVKDDLPRADLILSRDCLVHLTFEDALNAIRNFKRSGSTFLLTTTFTERTSNNDLVGQYAFWRPLNLQLAPFCFPQPYEIINEQCTEGNKGFMDKCLALWKLDDITLQEN